jgi:type IV secretory pathway VirB3-like protein
MASLSFGKPTPQKVFLATLLALIFGVFLDKFGLLQYSVGFLVGIVFTLAAELLAIYYFVLKIEAKNEKRLNECVVASYFLNPVLLFVVFFSVE